TELLCLPYWNTMIFAVLNAMHNLFLGELKQHLTMIWGMSAVGGNPEDSSKCMPHTPAEQAKKIEGMIRALQEQSASHL
ncbi:hypothetical protein SERLADRAFT_344961, partial [Serpula lacrymans var. lacrymans S7.9]